jgi:hypothetical protein
MSAPARFLLESGRLSGRILDFGCGRGKDAELLKCEKYDPHFFPKFPRGKFDTVLVTYVLNVLGPDGRHQVYADVCSLLNENGTAFFAVRRDIKSDTNTQFIIDLLFPIVKSTSGFCIYEWSPNRARKEMNGIFIHPHF